mmetsp:Transcript_8847/g.21620  ORF Transcript_8847/g.21620 Transcript_8847/m.21620 type:complete len:228 (+) Transcript_8847:493-1176(+)
MDRRLDRSIHTSLSLSHSLSLNTCPRGSWRNWNWNWVVTSCPRRSCGYHSSLRRQHRFLLLRHVFRMRNRKCRHRHRHCSRLRSRCCRPSPEIATGAALGGGCSLFGDIAVLPVAPSFPVCHRKRFLPRNWSPDRVPDKPGAPAWRGCRPGSFPPSLAGWASDRCCFWSGTEPTRDNPIGWWRAATPDPSGPPENRRAHPWPFRRRHRHRHRHPMATEIANPASHPA